MTDHFALVRLTGSFACLLVLAGCGTSSTTANDVPAPAPAPSPVPTTVAAPEDADVVFDELVAFVEDTRGFSFEQPPTLRVVGPGDAAFEGPYDEEWLRVDESRYRALGILGPDFESDPCLADGSGCDAVGYYDPVTDEMVVSSTETGWGPAVRATIVHELTHALQEQRGDLIRLDEIWWRDFEARDVLDALIEGEATLMEDLYLDSLPARARWLRWDEEVAIAGPDRGEPIPYLDYVGYYPYDEGARAVTAAYHAGGWNAVDTLFADPPATTEALEYPDAAVSVDEAPIEMPELSPDGFELFATGRWGKNDFDGYLLDAMPAHEIDSGHWPMVSRPAELARILGAATEEGP